MKPELQPSAPTSRLQQSIATALARAVAQSLQAHAPARDGGSASCCGVSTAPLPCSLWRTPRGSSASAAALHLAASQAPDQATRTRFAMLYARCLVHYREQLRASEPEDDAGAALACFLAACLQGLQGHAVTPERWQALATWVNDFVDAQAAWQAAPAAEQQDFFERMAILAAAVGEWSVQASRQGAAAIAAARAMATQHLKAQLGLDAADWVHAMRHLQIVAGHAANPSWGDAELPTVPAFGVQDHRL